MINSLLEFVERAIGPLLFTVAMTSFLIALAGLQDYSNVAQARYTQDNVYSQGGTQKVEDMNTLTGSEVYTRMSVNLTVPTTIIKDNTKVELYKGSGGTIEAKVYGKGSNMPNQDWWSPSTSYHSSLASVKVDGGTLREFLSCDFTQVLKHNEYGDLIGVEYKEED